ncbi:nitroreductase family protein [Peredibacter starrii]|uniref:Nitroreductase family protein n=1 Tax=Peredibacter starrii TaxID=28202 RepID=A0AAX4HNS6_9BACT|nr:nitroreductase family protein [Peredibacter starrii]WPU64788.1 nitroreductase family protein [Peredibacter starrii]
MQNKIFEGIASHRSIRKYKDQEVSDDIIHQIAETAMNASSSGNMQSYSIIVTKDKKLRKKLYPLHFKQSMVLDAPVLITFCADFNRMRKWVRQNRAPMNFDNYMSFMIASIDATLVAQNFALLAESVGLGICFMGTTLANAHEIGRVLNCPANVVPVVGFSLGYPDEAPEVRKRLPLSGVIHQEKYQDYTPEQVGEIYQERETLGMKRYSEVPELKKMMKKHRATNLAEVYTKVKYTRESHITYSQNVLTYLSEQNFMNHS